MNYAVISTINGNFKIESEHGNDKQAAMVDFHDKCKIYWNAPDVETGTVMVVDESLCNVDGHTERITHNAQTQPQTNTAQTAEVEEG